MKLIASCTLDLTKTVRQKQRKSILFFSKWTAIQLLTPTKLFVIGATNRPWALDAAANRRFPAKLYIPAPGYKERIAFVRDFFTRYRRNVFLTNAELTYVPPDFYFRVFLIALI